MENFILYEEIGRGKNSIVYKGRRKGTIKFLAILCIDKIKRPAITNWVRLVHEVEHENIVKFYEWYETSNHLWMVVELCTGGLLQEVLNQDEYLPEMTVCQFGKDIVEGLCYLHKHGIIFADLCPKKILLDGPGRLKLTNFCLSRLLQENLEDVYFQATVDDSDADQLKSTHFIGVSEYQAPEVLNGEAASQSSDIWSFGILLFQLYFGSFPLLTSDSTDNIKMNDDFTKYKRKSFHRHMHQELKEEKPSTSFLNLLKLILQKQPEKRPSAEELSNHSFWNLYSTNEVKSQNNQNVKTETVIGDSIVKSSLKSSTTFLKNESGDWAGKRCATPESVNVLDSTFTLSSRPRTAYMENQAVDDKLTNNPSSKSTNSLKPDLVKDTIESVKSSLNKRPTSALSGKSVILDSLVIHDEPMSVQNTCSTRTTTHLDVKECIYHDTDFDLSVIQDNPQVRKVESLKWETKSLPFQSFSSIVQVSSDEIYKHLKQLSEALNQPSSPNLFRSKSNVLIYLSHLCTCSEVVANYVINSTMLGQLASIIKSLSQQSPDITIKALRTIGLAASYSTELEYRTRISDIFHLLIDFFRDNFRNTRLKTAILPCVGQLLFLVTEQENACVTMNDHTGSSQHSNWQVPLACYTLISKCLREGEDPVVQHYACKTIEAVTTITSQHGKKFINALSQSSTSQSSSNSDVIGSMLWVVASRATNENLKVSALSALCRLNKLSGSGATFQAAVDRAGLSNVLSILSRASFKCQQAIVTSLIETLSSAPKGHASRLANGKDLLSNMMRLFESPSSLVRTKAILAVLLILKKVPNGLVTACQQRLIMYIERESRRVAVTSAGQNSAMSSCNEYTQSCLNLLVHYLSMQAPLIATNCRSILDETVTRKHPSTNQVKQLRQLLPTCTVLQHFVTSQIFRSQIVNSELIQQLGLLLSHASIFFKKHSQLSSSIGDEIIQKFVDAVISIVECLSQHPLVLTQHAESSLSCLVPNIILLLGAYEDGNGQIVCLKLLTDVLGALLHYQAISTDINPPPLTPLSTPSSRSTSALSSRSSRYNRCHDISDEYGVLDIVKNNLVPELKSVLSSKDPLPSYGVRLLGTLLEYWPSLSVEIAEHDLIPLLMSLFEKQAFNLKLYVQGVTTVLTYMVQYNDDKVVSMIYEKGLIETLGSYISKTSKHYDREDSSSPNTDVSSLTECLIQLLSLLKAMLDRVTIYVKQTLQNQNVSVSDANNQSKKRAENAEQLLIDHKPLTEMQSICIKLLCSEQELHELALACLSMLVQLFGGDHPDTMSSANMSYIAQTLARVQPKRQKILLKLIKRIVSLNKNHANSLASPSGSNLLQSIQIVHDNAEKIADASAANLAADILKATS